MGINNIDALKPDPDVICVEEGCKRMATHSNLIGVEMVDIVGDGEPFTSYVELVCAKHKK